MSDTAPAATPAKGTFAPASATDIRSPCPILNALANHGHLPRSGREIRVEDFTHAMHEVGLSSALGGLLSHTIYLERRDLRAQEGYSFLSSIAYVLRHPLALAFWCVGMRRPGQKDTRGHECLNLDQLGLHGAVEHDISLTRRDIAQGDNISPQADLIRELLDACKDGKTMRAEDLAALRRERTRAQKEANPEVNFGSTQNMLACGEIALILKVFGHDMTIPLDRVEALFRDERLPSDEGWVRRSSPLGFVELQKTTDAMKALVKDGSTS